MIIFKRLQAALDQLSPWLLLACLELTFDDGYLPSIPVLHLLDAIVFVAGQGRDVVVKLQITLDDPVDFGLVMPPLFNLLPHIHLLVELVNQLAS